MTAVYFLSAINLIIEAMCLVAIVYVYRDRRGVK